MLVPTSGPCPNDEAGRRIGDNGRAVSPAGEHACPAKCNSPCFQKPPRARGPHVPVNSQTLQMQPKPMQAMMQQNQPSNKARHTRKKRKGVVSCSISAFWDGMLQRVLALAMLHPFRHKSQSVSGWFSKNPNHSKLAQGWINWGMQNASQVHKLGDSMGILKQSTHTQATRTMMFHWLMELCEKWWTPVNLKAEMSLFAMDAWVGPCWQ